MIEKKPKNIHIAYDLHRKLKSRAFEKDTTLEKELNEILDKELNERR